MSCKVHHYMCAAQKPLTAKNLGKDLPIRFVCSGQPLQALCNQAALFADLLKVYPLQPISELLALRKKIILKAYELISSPMKFKMSEQVVYFADYQIKPIS